MARSHIPLRVVVAAAQHNGIGLAGTIPWNLPGDRALFRRVTTETQRSGAVNAVIMGRRTWQSLPARVRPLPDRVNVVLSREADFCSQIAEAHPGVLAAGSLEEALALLQQNEDVETAFAMGGAHSYCAALRHEACDRVYLTRVDAVPECDTFLPEVSRMGFAMVSEEPAVVEDGLSYSLQVFERAAVPPPAPGGARHEEEQYLDLIRDILANGVQRGDRTGTGTLSKFGATMRFSLRDNVLPLLTTKRVFWRGVAEELLWFVKGSTNAGELQEKNIHIWDGNGSREFLDSRGLGHREEGDLGPVYGFQWRHFGAEYSDMHASYEGMGVDQLAAVIETIKTNPTDRRIIMTAWNPAALPLMALPPCHMFCQFYVANGELSCQMYQRSADLGLGVPFNIASYSLLTRMVAQVCGLQPGEFVHVIGDAHVYLNHVEPLREQLEREPRPFPRLVINPEKTDIDSFVYDDFTLEEYHPYKSIKMQMAV